MADTSSITCTPMREGAPLPAPPETLTEALLGLARRMRDVMIAFSAEDGDEADLFRRDIEAELARAEGA